HGSRQGRSDQERSHADAADTGAGEEVHREGHRGKLKSRLDGGPSRHRKPVPGWILRPIKPHHLLSDHPVRGERKRPEAEPVERGLAEGPTRLRKRTELASASGDHASSSFR